MLRRKSRIRALALAAFVAVPLGWLPSASSLRAEQGIQAERSTVDLPALFDAVVKTVDQRFVDPERLKQLDWTARAQAARPGIVAAGSADEAVERINQLLAALKTSHTGLFTPDDYRYYFTLDAIRGASTTAELTAERFWGSGPYFPGIGAFTTVREDRHFIDGVLEGSPADKAGLKFGDEILTVDESPYSPIAAFRGKIGWTVAVEVRTGRGAAPVRHLINVVPIIPSVAFAGATRASARVIESEGKRFGYVHVWAVTEPRPVRAALDAIDPEGSDKRLDGLIVDMRGRVGGSVGVAEHLLSMLGKAEKPYWGALRFIDRTGKETAARNDQGGPSTRAFQGRTVLLIDHQTRSAGEIMAYGYKHSRFGTVIGTPTAGAVTSGWPHGMPGGLMLYVAASALEFNGTRLEGVGVFPDIRVERPLPYAGGADPVLDAALAHLSKSEPDAGDSGQTTR